MRECHGLRDLNVTDKQNEQKHVKQTNQPSLIEIDFAEKNKLGQLNS